jgi:8-oxo-dGTP pyrophosphatase MutT (NUDIX family)
MSARDPWSQHMAFPGGKLEARDSSLRETAIRETGEELGLNLEESADYLGPLPALSVAQQGRKLEIKPFVFGLRHVPELALNHEVDKVIWVPLESLSNGSMDTTVVRDHAGQSHTFPAWGVSGQQVWGLTYRMIQSLLTLLRENA